MKIPSLTPHPHLQLCDKLPGSSVEFLDTSLNPFGDSGTVHIASCLGAHPVLTTLWLEGCGIKEAGAKILAQSITNNKYTVRCRSPVRKYTHRRRHSAGATQQDAQLPRTAL